jgi:predicted Zn-ribbon and HTH transcriptional regulator
MTPFLPGFYALQLLSLLLKEPPVPPRCDLCLFHDVNKKPSDCPRCHKCREDQE